MRSEKEIRNKLEELEENCGKNDYHTGNRIRALKWVLENIGVRI